MTEEMCEMLATRVQGCGIIHSLANVLCSIGITTSPPSSITFAKSSDTPHEALAESGGMCKMLATRL